MRYEKSKAFYSKGNASARILLPSQYGELRWITKK